ncbi:MAG: butyrate kinase, partial [Bacilli bacterium]|nr:butyrate kinase [Bacilli bacterium]
MTKNKYRVLSINPGSTSTKIGLFDNDKIVFKQTIEHSNEDLAKFAEIADQYEFRLNMVIDLLAKEGIDINTIDAFSGRGGSLEPCRSGTYEINDLMYNDAYAMRIVKHPAALGIVIAKNLADKYHKRAFCVNPPDVDEFILSARITGMPNIYRESRIHALNQKEVAIRYAKSIKKDYKDLNLIVCHLGGGISIAAHHKGKMIDCNDNINGDGPMTPTRSG